MSSGVDSVSLPLRLPAAKSHRAKDIRSAIAQISSQRGHFRNVTEESLLTEIKSSIARDPDANMDSDPGEDSTEEDRDRPKNIHAGREETLKQISIARNEVFAALEFVSFLLSKYNPRQAELSLSPETRTNLKPLGTLEATTITRKDPPPDVKRAIDAVSRGYKTEAFRSCSTNLADAGKRLRREAEAESKFWQQVMSIKANGWAVSRIPRRKEAWVVHFGFGESDRAFRDRGMAFLKRQEDGDIYLDFGPSSFRQRSLRVTISDASSGQTSVSTTQRNTGRSEGQNKIQKLLQQARDTLFEEELYHEVCREARILTSYGIETRSEGVVFEMDGGRQTLISLVDTQERDQGRTHRSSTEAGPGAEELAVLLRLLLSHAHSENLRRRSQPPPPMTMRPRTTPEYYLVRPILCHSYHRAALRTIQNLLSVSTSHFNASQIPFANQASYYNQLSKLSSSDTNLWLNSLISEPLTTNLSLTLPTSHKLELRVRTQAAPPIFGTELSVVSSLPKYTFVAPRTAPRLTSLPDIEDFILQSLNNDLLAWVESNTWQISVNDQHTGVNGEAMDTETSNENVEAGKSFRWEVYDHLEGHLKSSILGLGGKPRYQMKTRLRRDYLETHITDQMHPDKIREAYRWRKQGEAHVLQRVRVKGGSAGHPENIPLLPFEELVETILRERTSNDS